MTARPNSARSTYNALGKVTRTVDPAGRETQFVYDANLIDLLQVKQKTSATAFSTIAEFTYNSQHLSLTGKGAAGQIRGYGYNSAGQVTDALGQVTRNEYDSRGYLTRIVNPNGQTAASFTYGGRPGGNSHRFGRTLRGQLL